MSDSEISADLAGRNTRVRSRAYFITWNSYPENWKDIIINNCNKYVAQEEIGINGNKHIQGYISFKNQRSFNTVKALFEGAHLEIPKSHIAAMNYCKKFDTRNGEQINNINKPLIKDPLEGLTYYDWQQNIINIIESDPDNRTIHWFWEPNGNIGKTTFCKHLALKYKGTIVLSGKASDAKYGVFCYLKKHSLNIVIFHFVRSNENYVSYEAIECIKDGLFYNVKYESDMCLYNNPHVLIFSNFEPDIDKLSKDRWNVRLIE
jgi:hypothetical protein